MSITDAAVTRRHPPTSGQLQADVWLAGALLLGAVLSAWLGQIAGVFYEEETPGLGWALLYTAGMTVPLAVRRRFPCTVLIVVAVAYFVAMSARVPEFYVSQIALFIAMYTVGAWVDDRRRATVVRVIVIAGMFVWLLVTMFQAATDPAEGALSQAGAMSPFVAFSLINLLVNAAFFGGAYYFGERAYAQAIARLVIEERTAELERERELTAAQAVALDRVRIARELHDVVAHHVSAMGVQAGAARTVLDRDPTAARTALAGIETSARAAIDDLHHLLDTLRTPDADTPDDSTLSLATIDDLVAHARENGLPTTLTVVGEPVEVPALVQVNLYRIAQEALTNARRHGGPEATADVRLRYATDAVELEVTNTGLNRAGGRPGLGLVGMRERAAASGGTVEAGPRPRGGFLVRARVPVAAAAPAGAPA
ncbi:sensor histidine kinase [Microbacterium sp. bgisy189]|uniref:sensor histidine kinase n=1 Tax=Microbacterium sp. bgisy189 TaxID=3413798 RepID=UPI003EBAB8A0